MSQRKLKSIHYAINEFCKMQQGQMSFETKNSLSKRLKTIANDLHTLGYKLPNMRNIKQKHIQALVDNWKANGLSAGTIKNRMSNIRYVCRAYGRETVVKSNHELGIQKRSYIPTESKAITNVNISKLKDERLRLSVALQQQFGLRREECLKIKPEQALKTNSDGEKYLQLQGSWTKGGVERNVPIRTEAQLNVLQEAINLVGKGSMIPTEQTYIERRNQYDFETHRAGLSNLHGLRHAYAQQRYAELTNQMTKGNGWRCSIAGGLKRYQLSKVQKEVDKLAKMQISSELGHSRVAIVKNYCG
jgi:site-specific recombinase XerD